jgi:CRISPR-associated protein Csy1
LTDAAYSDAAKGARKARKTGTYYASPTVSYPDVARQSFGGTKPQNISQLNTGRYGQGFLLSSQPPSWKKQPTPPRQGKNAFWREYDRRAWKTANFLQRYLEKTFDQGSTVEHREFRGELVDELIDMLLICAAEIQSMNNNAGWSVDSDLSKAEQLWLDPHRSAIDEEFGLEREQNDWQGEIANQFAAWLNRKISYKSKKLYADDATYQVWSKLLKRKLALLKEDLEVTV